MINKLFWFCILSAFVSPAVAPFMSDIKKEQLIWQAALDFIAFGFVGIAFLCLRKQGKI